MLRPHEATPCPPPTLRENAFQIGSQDLDNTFGGRDSTSKIDFTTDVQASFHIAGPKRRTTSARPKRLGKVMGCAVHQDEAQPATHDHHPSNSKGSISAGSKPSSLAQPAQRPGSKVNFAPEITHTAPSYSTTETGGPGQNELLNAESLRQPTAGMNIARSFTKIDGMMKKSARRGTVYIPSEDTTMPTIWMGVFSPIKDMGALGHNSTGDQNADLTGLVGQIAKKRGPRNSFTAPPKRGALRRSLRPLQETTISEDIPGQLTGKENLPPGHETSGSKKAKKMEPLGESSPNPHRASRRSVCHAIQTPYPSSHGSTNLSANDPRPAAIAKSICGPTAQPRTAGLISEHDMNENFVRLRLSGERKQAPWKIHGKDVPGQLPMSIVAKVPAKLIIPTVSQVVDQKYPLLSENIHTPSLYEDNWLNHQEIAITQLVNNLIDVASGSSIVTDSQIVRSQLLTVYQDPASVLVHKRLQASILYGSLTMPKETLEKSSRLPEDLGMKQKFLNLWLNTFDLQALQACAEVVIGRECSTVARSSSASQSSRSPNQKKVSRQSLSRYLEMFLIRNEDMTVEKAVCQVNISGIPRTLLRSLMLIKLLDKVKTSAKTLCPSCLFQPCSPYKSSVCVIEALAQMLHPSAGNMMRSLNHIGYHVSHVQYPLEEYDYRITNLAIDVRDGVRLTRLVELLLYPSASHLSRANNEGDTTTNVVMPTGEVLSLLQGEMEWPLSQHLKLPCLGRATKCYNVQIALSALMGVKGVNQIAKDIKAEHIVDGFREKTVALLWGLCSKWGLGSLIYWGDVKSEIRRLGGSIEDIDEEGSLDSHKALLKEWAHAAAAKKGLGVLNMTTSFADGRIFEAIVDEYEPFLHDTASRSGDDVPKGTLSQRLSALGCSAQFALLFSHASTTSHIFDEDFILSSLVFLASRLLSASRPARAATTIQRAYRVVLKRRGNARMAALKELAAQCALVVQAREKLSWAGGVIWRAWMGYRERKMSDGDLWVGL